MRPLKNTTLTTHNRCKADMYHACIDKWQLVNVLTKHNMELHVGKAHLRAPDH